MSNATATRTLSNFVNGEQVPAADGRMMDLVNPATGEVFARAPVSDLPK
jgi:betaine-aldehyde dehydrogenase